MTDYNLNQSGKKETFPGGAQRDSQKGKPRYDLIPPLALRRVADLYTKGAEHYGDRNWEKGMPFSRMFASLLRHAYQFAMGHREEDHLAAVVFNALGIMHFQELRHTSLDDMSHLNKWKVLNTKPSVLKKCPTCHAHTFHAETCPHCGSSLVPQPKKPKPLTVTAVCPQCGQVICTLGFCVKEVCLRCGLAFNPQKNLEKNLTSDPTPARIGKPAGHWQGCPCPTCQPHPQEKE